MSPSKLIEAWRAFDPDRPPFLLDGDEALLELDEVVVIESVEEFLEHPEFDFLGSRAIHLGLLPVPFVGDLDTADIFVLLQNPGLRPSDYFAEFEDGDLRAALKGNLAQRWTSEELPFPGLDPRFSYNGGYEYWRRKFRGLLTLLMRQRGCLLREALSTLARRIAVLELFPYHSSVGAVSNPVLGNLRSVDLVRRFVHDDLVPRTERGEALVIVTRQARLWDLEESEGIIVYGASEARSAHLSPKSRGGAAIARHLGLGSC